MKLSMDKGFSLVEMLVAAGIMGVIALSMSSLLVNQSKQTTFVENKLDRSELRNLMLQAFVDEDVCTWQLQGKGAINIASATSSTVFSPTTMTIPKLYLGKNTTSAVLAAVGQHISSRGSSPVVKSIHFKNIYQPDPTNENKIRGDIVIDFVEDKTQITLQAISYPVIVTLDSSTPKSAKAVSACGPIGSDTTTGQVLCAGTGVAARGAGCCGSSANTVSCASGVAVSSKSCDMGKNCENYANPAGIVCLCKGPTPTPGPGR
jgi:prepilin-type N-terminal cleavage/methylation domain-containing protein